MDLSIKRDPPEEKSDGRYVWIEVPDVKTVTIKHEREEQSDTENDVKTIIKCEPKEEISASNSDANKPNVNIEHDRVTEEDIVDPLASPSVSWGKQQYIANQDTYAEEPIDSEIHKQYKPGKKKYDYDKPVECNVCMKKFNRKANLTIHERTHDINKLFKCDICMKKFSQVSDLNRHKRIHSGEKPYVCNVCMSSFNQISTLTMHKRIHTGEKPFECNICERKFSGVSTLNKHKKVHSGEKSLECDVCKKKFVRMSNLRSHKRIHSDEKPFDCEFCKMKFRHKASFNRHIKRMHIAKKLQV